MASCSCTAHFVDITTGVLRAESPSIATCSPAGVWLVFTATRSFSLYLTRCVCARFGASFSLLVTSMGRRRPRPAAPRPAQREGISTKEKLFLVRRQKAPRCPFARDKNTQLDHPVANNQKTIRSNGNWASQLTQASRASLNAIYVIVTFYGEFVSLFVSFHGCARPGDRPLHERIGDSWSLFLVL